MEETDKPAKVKKEEKVVTVVLNELPKQEVRNLVGEDGVNYNAVTVDEALTEILDTVRQLKKGLL